ncbi:MAG: hypothetical protein A2174_00130 [Candidatus Portnoybacteria bacterium RBG_13_41_18]|uniref:SHOCT domain-containing protein n=1 Tax=Candidatus Portnoybacteria bacterium RBG_13_41_18 TaxID=1801991 RepID=A0A1G2FA68_9BACT|nr:MAG: hypothetical protein A2174_00130 [Candidatus Portnoybacteria bacterium RBG_13_41_18]
MMGGGWGGMFFGLIFWVLIIVGIIWLISWIAREGGMRRELRGGSSATEILKERYAKGEINKQEFEEKMKDLSK